MVTVDWSRFSSEVAAFARAAGTFREAAFSAGVFDKTLRQVAERQGRLGTELFLTLCQWMNADPMSFLEGQDRGAA